MTEHTDARSSPYVKLNVQGKWVKWHPGIKTGKGEVSLADVPCLEHEAKGWDNSYGIVRDALGNIIKINGSEAQKEAKLYADRAKEKARREAI